MSEEKIGRYLDYRLDGDVAVLRLNRPEKRNAISDAQVEALAQACDRAQAEARAVVLSGAGPHFSAGLDLSEHSRKPVLDALRASQRWHEVFSRIERSPVPWIAALHGAVIGGGLELAAAAHIRVADRSAYFGLPEGQRGIFVGGGGSVRIARLIGVARMTDMMLTGRTIDAVLAEHWNLVQYVTDEGGAEAQALTLARAAAANAAFSNTAIIQTLPLIRQMPEEGGLFLESFVSSVASITPDAEERLKAFLEKRAGRVTRP